MTDRPLAPRDKKTHSAITYVSTKETISVGTGLRPDASCGYKTSGGQLVLISMCLTMSDVGQSHEERSGIGARRGKDQPNAVVPGAKAA